MTRRLGHRKSGMGDLITESLANHLLLASSPSSQLLMPFWTLATLSTLQNSPESASVGIQVQGRRDI